MFCLCDCVCSQFGTLAEVDSARHVCSWVGCLPHVPLVAGAWEGLAGALRMRQDRRPPLGGMALHWDGDDQHQLTNLHSRRTGRGTCTLV